MYLLTSFSSEIKFLVTLSFSSSIFTTSENLNLKYLYRIQNMISNKYQMHNMWANWFKLYTAQYLRSCFNLWMTDPSLTADFGKILCVFAVSMGRLQTLLLVLENSPFLCIMAVFLNKFL